MKLKRYVRFQSSSRLEAARNTRFEHASRPSGPWVRVPAALHGEAAAVCGVPVKVFPDPMRVTIEGPQGCGKNLLADVIVASLRQAGKKVQVINEEDVAELVRFPDVVIETRLPRVSARLRR